MVVPPNDYNIPAKSPGGVRLGTVQGVVEAALPQGLYRVKTDDGVTLTVSLTGLPKQTIVRVIPGDRILVEVSPLDPSRGRIKERLH